MCRARPGGNILGRYAKVHWRHTRLGAGSHGAASGRGGATQAPFLKPTRFFFFASPTCRACSDFCSPSRGSPAPRLCAPPPPVSPLRSAFVCLCSLQKVSFPTLSDEKHCAPCRCRLSADASPPSSRHIPLLGGSRPDLASFVLIHSAWTDCDRFESCFVRSLLGCEFLTNR